MLHCSQLQQEAPEIPENIKNNKVLKHFISIKFSFQIAKHIQHEQNRKGPCYHAMGV